VYCWPKANPVEAVSVLSSQTDQKKEDQTKKETSKNQKRIIKIKQLHQTVAKAVLTKGHPLDERVNEQIFVDFAEQYPVDKCDNCGIAPPKYAEILAMTERELRNERVDIEIASSPKDCQIKY